MQLSKVVIDVNIPAIYLVEDHPGHSYVYGFLNRLLENGARIYAHSVTPFRVYWILTKVWGIDKREALDAISWFVENIEIDYVGLTREWINESFRLAEKLRHDVYDCSYLALALMVKAEAIATTDTDFETIAPRLGLRYVNPVPPSVLRRFRAYNSGSKK